MKMKDLKDFGKMLADLVNHLYPKS